MSRALVTLTMALSDGLFVAQEVGEVKLEEAFDLLATAILGTVAELRGTTRPLSATALATAWTSRPRPPVPPSQL